MMLKKNIAFQFLLFAIVAILIFISFVMLSYFILEAFEEAFENYFSYSSFFLFLVFSPLIQMILSFIYIRPFLFLYKKGFFDLLDIKKYYLRINLFSLLLLTSTILLYIQPNSWSGGFGSLFFVVYLGTLPFHISISPLVFVLHDRKFAILYFFGLLLPYLLSPVVFFALLPLLIYYPIMIQYTNHLKRKYNINLPIKPDPIIAWFKKTFKKTINKLFKKPFNKLFQKSFNKLFKKPSKKAEVKQPNKP